MSTKKHFKLPKGGKLLEPAIKRQIGGWSEQELDAKIIRFGLTLYRVKDGMGGNGDREDWIVDVPSGCVSIHDYQYRAPYWGFEKYSSFDKAIAGQIQRGIEHEKGKIINHERKAEEARKSLQLLKHALTKSK